MTQTALFAQLEFKPLNNQMPMAGFSVKFSGKGTKEGGFGKSYDLKVSVKCDTAWYQKQQAAISSKKHLTISSKAWAFQPNGQTWMSRGLAGSQNGLDGNAVWEIDVNGSSLAGCPVFSVRAL